jgi:hypothetical protein
LETNNSLETDSLGNFRLDNASLDADSLQTYGLDNDWQAQAELSGDRRGG